MSFKKEGRFYKGPEGIRYAGRTDTLAKCSGTFKGVTLDGIFVFDYKSAKDPKKYHPRGYPEWHLQTAAYRAGISTKIIEQVGKITGNATVRLDKFSGLVDVFDHSDTYEQNLMAFRKLVEFYEWMYPERLEKGIPSVTTIIGVLEKPALIQWAANCAVDYINEQMTTFRGRDIMVETSEVETWLVEAKRYWRRVKDKAANIGTEVHKLIEVFLETGQEPHVPSLSIPVTNAWNAFLEFYEAYKIEVIATEVKVYGSF